MKNEISNGIVSRSLHSLARVVRPLFVGPVLIGGSIAWLTPAVPVAAAQPEIPTYFVKSDFRLPFDIGPASRRPKSLELLVSRDAGQSWRVHQSVAPTERSFEVNGAFEGEYLLSVQARDEAASIISRRVVRLVIDRTAPEVNLECAWNGQKTLSIQCSVKDRTADFEQVSLEYRCDNAAEYQPLPLDLASHSGDQLVCSSSLELPDCKRFELLLTARDRAGNDVSTSQKFDTPSSGEPSSETAAVTGTERSSELPRSSTLLAAHRKPAIAVESDVNTPTQLTADSLQLEFGLRPPQTTTSEPTTDNRSDAILPDTTQSPAADDKVLVVEQRKFAVAYEAQTATEPVQAVELWGTEDSGATWQFWGYDSDLVSPCRIEVAAAGTYGYCVVVVRNQADTDLRPRAGDQPDLWVAVRERQTVPRRAILTLIPTPEN